MTKKDKAWFEFCGGNPELLLNHDKVLGLAFEAGFLAGKQLHAKAVK